MSRWEFVAAWLLLACGGRSSDEVPLAGASGAGAGGEASAGGEAAAPGVAGEAGGVGCGADCALTWPGSNDVRELSTPELPLGNVSGVTYDSEEGALWVVVNIPGRLYRLVPQGDGFAPDARDGWSEGKLLHFPGGMGLADAEGVTFGASAASGLYVASEHDNTAASISRLSVLHYDPSEDGDGLSATREWDVTSALPAVRANQGIEAITFVPDELLRGALHDENLDKRYEPRDYPAHGGGLFVVGVEATGALHGFALNHDDGTFAKVFELSTPLPGVMSLEHDRETGYLWFGCDDACGNRLGVLRLGSDGRFALAGLFRAPDALPNSNHEGIALGAEADCQAGEKPIIWVDDDALDGVTLRRGHVPCGDFL